VELEQSDDHQRRVGRNHVPSDPDLDHPKERDLFATMTGRCQRTLRRAAYLRRMLTQNADSCANSWCGTIGVAPLYPPGLPVTVAEIDIVQPPAREPAA